MLGSRHLAGCQRPVRAAAAVGRAAARGLGAAVLHDGGHPTGQRGAHRLRRYEEAVTARPRLSVHLHPPVSGHTGPVSELLPVYRDRRIRRSQPLRVVPRPHILRGSRGLYELSVVLPLLKTFPRRVSRYVLSGRGFEWLLTEFVRLDPGGRRKSGMRSFFR